MAETETVELSPVERIAGILAEGDLEVYIARVGDEQQIEKLQILLGQDAQQRDYAMQVFFVSDITDHLDLGGAEEGYDCALLQFFLLFPFEIGDRVIGEALRVVNVINRALPVGGIGVSEVDRAFFLHYQLVTEDREVPAVVLQETVSMLGFGVASYGSALELVARGELTAEQFVEQLQELGLNLPSVGDPLAQPTA